MADPATAGRYAALKRRAGMIALALDLAYLAALPALGVAQVWAGQVADWSPWPWTVAVYVTGLALPWTVALLPLDWYRGFRLEHQFGLSRESLGRWAWRWLKAQLLGGVLLLGVAVVLIGLLRARPATWWWWASVAWWGWSVVLTQWMPVVLLPLFYRQRPLADTALAARVARLAAACGARVRGVYELDISRETAKANAALCGLGATRRVVLTDTLLAAYTPEEIETVVAHELGHHALRHLPRLLALNAVAVLASFWVAGRVLPGLLAAFGIEGLGALAALPVVGFLLSVIGLVLTPVHHGLSRRFERAADRFALERTQAPQVFAAALRKLGRQNLAEESPSRWVEWFWYDHPPIAQRIAMAEQFQHRVARSGSRQ